MVKTFFQGQLKLKEKKPFIKHEVILYQKEKRNKIFQANGQNTRSDFT